MVLTSIIGEQFEGSIDILAKLTGKLEIQIQFELSHRVSQYISRDKKLVSMWHIQTPINFDK